MYAHQVISIELITINIISKFATIKQATQATNFDKPHERKLIIC